MRIRDWSSDVCSSDLSGRPSPCRPIITNSPERKRKLGGRLIVKLNRCSFQWRTERTSSTVSEAEGASLAASAIRSLITLDRKSAVSGKSVSVRVDLGGRRLIKKKNKPLTKEEKDTFMQEPAE